MTGGRPGQGGGIPDLPEFRFGLHTEWLPLYPKRKAKLVGSDLFVPPFLILGGSCLGCDPMAELCLEPTKAKLQILEVGYELYPRLAATKLVHPSTSFQVRSP